MKTVHSLRSLCVDYSVKHLSSNHAGDLERLRLLPANVKDKMLHKFLSSPFFWKAVDFKAVLAALTHSKTTTIDLTSARVDDDMLKTLERCIRLRKLYLTKVGEQDVSTDCLAGLFAKTPNLHTVRLSNCAPIEDAVIEVLAGNCPHLKGLDLTGCSRISDKALMALAPLENITWISLSGTFVTNVGVKALCCGPSGGHIKELRLANCGKIDDSVLGIVADNCPEITVLVFWNYESPNDEIDLTDVQKGNLRNLKQLTWTISW